MKIQTIEITNYKAFWGTHEINVGGKNLFIYGKNGNGKSSLPVPRPFRRLVQIFRLNTSKGVGVGIERTTTNTAGPVAA